MDKDLVIGIGEAKSKERLNRRLARRSMTPSWSQKGSADKIEGKGQNAMSGLKDALEEKFEEKFDYVGI